MADIINLNKARKGRGKTVKDVRAKQNRASYGRNKAEKKADNNRRARQTKELDDLKLDDRD